MATAISVQQLSVTYGGRRTVVALRPLDLTLERGRIAGILGLHEADGAALGADRALFLPSRTYSVAEMIAGMRRVAEANGIAPGPVTPRPDPAIEAIVASWPTRLATPRAEALGLPNDESLDRVIQDYIDDFM